MGVAMNAPAGKKFRGFWADARGSVFEVFTRPDEMLRYWCYVRKPGKKKLIPVYDPGSSMLMFTKQAPEIAKQKAATRSAALTMQKGTKPNEWRNIESRGDSSRAA